MRVLIDACVLFPTVLREVVIETAKTGAFSPVWSGRILEEWKRAAARHSEKDAVIAASEIARLKAHFPDAMATPTSDTELGLSLPDPDDVHVLATAIDGRADELLTLNVKDFPTNVLAAHGIIRRHPDEFMFEQFHTDPNLISNAVKTVFDRAATHGIDTSNQRALLKRARLPRLGKALNQS